MDSLFEELIAIDSGHALNFFVTNLREAVGTKRVKDDEVGGSQILLFAGFFRDRMSRRHNVKWYDQLGQSLYEKASRHSGNLKKRELFDRLSESFPVWTIVCGNLSRTLRENRLLLKFN